MARRRVLRSWVTASVLAVSSAAGVFVTSLPARAAAAIPDPVVTVYPDRFVTPWGGTTVYARPKQLIKFVLADANDTHHTVTIEPVDCGGHASSLCEQRFDVDDRSRGVEYFWSQEGDHHFFDRYAREEGRPPMTGLMVVTNSPPPVQPVTTTSSSTTTTMATTTTTMGPTTTTTAPTSIRPMLVPDPAPTTTTTRAANPAVSPTPAPASKSNDKDSKAKKAASPSTPTTAAPAPDGTMPPDSVFDPAALTPAPTLMPAPDGSHGDEAAIDASEAASLLDPQQADDDGSKLLLLAFGALALMLMVGGGWAWFTRASRYDPA